MTAYSITDSFIAGGVGQNGLTASAYAASRFSTPPAKNAAAPSGTADGTATTGSSYGNDGSFQITGLVAGQYWVSVTYSSTTYWKLYNIGAASSVGGLLTGIGAPASTLGATNDEYLDFNTGGVYGPKVGAVIVPAFRAGAAGRGSAVIPASVVAGDLLLLGMANDGAALTVPSGWTTLGSYSTTAYTYLAYKYATATDASSTITPAGAGTYCSVGIAAYNMQGTTPTPTVVNTQTISSGTALTIPGVSLANSQDHLVAVIAAGDNNVQTATLTTSAGSWEQTSSQLAAAVGFASIPSSGSTLTLTGWTATLAAAAWAVDIPATLAGWTLQGTIGGGSATQATLTGTTAGTAVSEQVAQGANYKKFLVYLNGYENTTATAQTITFPTAFTHTPFLAHDDSGGATVSTTTLTLPASMGAVKTGWIVVEGF